MLVLKYGDYMAVYVRYMRSEWAHYRITLYAHNNFFEKLVYLAY